MRHAAIFTALAALFLASPAIADDGQVPATTLDALGLSGLQHLSDEAGQQVRGMSSQAAATRGLSLVSGLLLDPATGSFIAGTDANFAKSAAKGSGYTYAGQAQASSLDLILSVNPPHGFLGALSGIAGGSSSASAH